MADKLRLIDKVARFYHEQPTDTAFSYFEGREIVSKTYQETYEGVCACRQYFCRSGKKRIGLLATNSWQWACHMWGMFASGASTALLDPLLPIEDMVSAIDRADLELLVVEDDLKDLGEKVREQLPQVDVIEFCDMTFEPGMDADFDKWEEGDSIFFTSGTSKHSKVVITPTCSIAGQILANMEVLRYVPGKTMMNPLPFHHSFGFVMLNLFYEGGCPIFISSMKTILHDIRKIQPTMLASVPNATEFLLKKKILKHPIESMVVAGSYCPPELAARVREQGVIIQNNYGSSELPCGIANNLPEDDVDTLTLHSYAHVMIADDGEVVVTCPYHMKEYYKNPEETAEVLHGDTVYTGDMGFLDDEGKLHIMGRKKNMIVMHNGEKVFCTDVDAELTALPCISDGAVIYKDQMLVAVVAPDKGMSKEDIAGSIEEYNRTQPYYRRIRKTWIYGPALPYTSSGKLHRSRLEREYNSEDDSVF